MTFPQMAAINQMAAEGFLEDQDKLGTPFTSYEEFEEALKVPAMRQVR